MVEKNMRKFVSSFWFSFFIAVLLSAAIAGSYWYLAPTGDNIGNYEILKAGKIAGWAIGPVLGLLFLVVLGILSLLKWCFRVHKIYSIRVLTILLALTPVVWLGWMLTGEDPYTPIARMVIDFVARPILLGSLFTLLITVVVSILSFFTGQEK